MLNFIKRKRFKRKFALSEVHEAFVKSQIKPKKPNHLVINDIPDLLTSSSLKEKINKAYYDTFVYGKTALMIGAEEMSDEMLELSQYTEKIADGTEILIIDDMESE